MSNDQSTGSAGASGGVAPTGWLSVSPRRNGPQLVLVVLGEADLSTAGQLRDELLAAFAFTPASIVVDVSGLTFCGLAGLDALNDVVAAADAFCIPLELRGMSRQLSWMHRRFPARPTAPAGRRALPAAPLVLVADSPPAPIGGRPGTRGERMPNRSVVWEKGA